MTTVRPISRPDKASSRTRRRYPRWRALSLSLVYVVFAIHIIHWKLTGKTLAPLELNEVMYTLELGIITAGFLFMCLLVLGTLIFGRFFCSWACHIMVLQELCAWCLRRIGILAKPIRSRFLLWVPPLTAVYMFLWPQVVRAWESRALPTFHMATDRDGWASLVTNNFWRNLPGPWIIALTFVVCGILMIYLLGSRTFCTYVCPYGAVFSLADRFSPGRILVHDNCKQCGRCTAVCTSGIRVHEETEQYGRVVNPACLKCLDCVSICPQEALHYGMSKPAFFASFRSGGRFGLPYDFTLAEELLAAMAFIAVVLTFRGLYSRIPFLLSLALGVMIGYAIIVLVRLAMRRDVRLSTLTLRGEGRLSRAGRAYGGAMALLSIFVGHSAFVRFHEYFGLRQVAMLGDTGPAANEALARRAFVHLAAADRWGLISNERVERGLATATFTLGRFDDVLTYANRYLSRHPTDAAIQLTVARTLTRKGDLGGGEREFRSIAANIDANNAAARPLWLTAKTELAELLTRRGDFRQAEAELRAVVTMAPDRAGTHADLGGVLAELGRFDEAISELKQAFRLDPSLGGAAYNLGTLLLHLDRVEEAVVFLQEAAQLISDDADLYNNLGSALLRSGRPDEAERQLQRALHLNPNHADAHFNLGIVLTARNDLVPAADHMRQAASLDPRYTHLLKSSE